MGGFPIFGGVVNTVVFEADAALLPTVHKLKIVKDRPGFGGLKLLLLVRLQNVQRPGIQFERVDDRPRSACIRAGQGENWIQNPDQAGPDAPPWRPPWRTS